MSNTIQNSLNNEPIIDLTVLCENGRYDTHYYVDGDSGVANDGGFTYIHELTGDLPNGSLVRFNYIDLDFAQNHHDWPETLEEALKEPAPEPTEPEKETCPTGHRKN